MGVTYTAQLFLGYRLTPDQVSEEAEQTKRFFSCSCRQNQRGKFCSGCGVPITKTIEKVSRVIERWEGKEYDSKFLRGWNRDTLEWVSPLGHKFDMHPNCWMSDPDFYYVGKHLGSVDRYEESDSFEVTQDTLDDSELHEALKEEFGDQPFSVWLFMECS